MTFRLLPFRWAEQIKHVVGREEAFEALLERNGLESKGHALVLERLGQDDGEFRLHRNVVEYALQREPRRRDAQRPVGGDGYWPGCRLRDRDRHVGVSAGGLRGLRIGEGLTWRRHDHQPKNTDDERRVRFMIPATGDMASRAALQVAVRTHDSERPPAGAEVFS